MMGRLGATVAGTDPCSTGGHPKLSTEKKKRRLQMNKFRFTINALAIAIFTFAFASMAQAQATRTWVSGVGDDVNPCSRTAPCKTFAGAISKTATGGEIDCLDPGGFGTVTITKSITLDGTTGAGFGSILASGTNGVIVSVSTNPSTSVVILRNLYINGTRQGISPGTNGIRYLAGNKLIVDHCTIFGFGTNGIDANLTTAGNLEVNDSIFEDNNIGIRATSSVAGPATLTTSIDGSRIVGGATGVDGLTGAKISVANTSVSHNSNFGIIAEAGVINVADSRVNNNGTGVQMQPGAKARIARCIITGNTSALGQPAGAGAGIDTGLNNTIMGNGTDQAPGGNPFPQN
jgi:hypothetical protein